MSEFPTAGAAREQSMTEAQRKREAERQTEERLRAMENLRITEIQPQITAQLSAAVLEKITNAIKSGKRECTYETSNASVHDRIPYQRAANAITTELKAQGYKANSLVWTSDGYHDSDMGWMGPWLNIRVEADWSGS